MQVQELRKINIPYNYVDDRERLKKFFLFFTDNGRFKYLDALREQSIELDLNDLCIYDDSGLASRFEENCYTYLSMAYSILDEISYDNNMEEHSPDDIFMHHRISRFKEKYPEKNVSEVLGFLLRNYSINVISRENRTFAIREVKAENIGNLINVRGIVTRVSQVKPSVRVATYICESCGTETYQQIKNGSFDMLEECTSEKCKIRKVKGTLCLVTRGSKFIKYQSVQIQEFTSDVPRGSVPRMLNLECYDTNTEVCRPGDSIVITGIFLPKPYYGYKKIRAGLLNDTFVHVLSLKRNVNEIDVLNDYKITSNIGEKTIEELIKSFAPEIFGMEDVKKILLLMLVSAPTITRADGMKIRGDINVLLLGDPGIAKSQLLKTVIKLSKRGVYTTGKGSSGVGLTASVSRDPITNEVVLEGGALVLSDKGVCCIDELDKMNENDRVSIHEVMEQQSVSISKAGINTTLNARAAILGAANPVRGRYDPKKSVEFNVNLPCSLLSRFDVLCILKDDFNNDNDLAMATHITNLHIGEESDASPPMNYTELSNYLSECKMIDSKMNPVLRNKLTQAYVSARAERQLTPRYLLSLIRMSLAHARLRKSEIVEEIDVNEAQRLMELMKLKVSEPNNTVSLKHSIYNYIIGFSKENHVDLNELFLVAPFERSKIEDVISDFEGSGIWVKNEDDLEIFN